MRISVGVFWLSSVIALLLPAAAAAQGSMITSPRIDPNKPPVWQTADPATGRKAGQCLAILPGAKGFRNYCDEEVTYAYCIIAPVHPFSHPTPTTSAGQPTCGPWAARETVSTSISRAGTRNNAYGYELDTRYDDLSGRSIEWFECRGDNVYITDGTTYVLGKGWRGKCVDMKTGVAHSGVTGSTPAGH